MCPGGLKQILEHAATARLGEHGAVGADTHAHIIGFAERPVVACRVIGGTAQVNLYLIDKVFTIACELLGQGFRLQFLAHFANSGGIAHHLADTPSDVANLVAFLVGGPHLSA